MTATNHNPIANPFTDRPIGNINWQRMAEHKLFRPASKCGKNGPQLPEAAPLETAPIDDWPEDRTLRGFDSWGASLQAPNLPMSNNPIDGKAAEALTAKLSAEMSEEQKQLLAEFEALKADNSKDKENSISPS